MHINLATSTGADNVADAAQQERTMAAPQQLAVQLEVAAALHTHVDEAAVTALLQTLLPQSQSLSVTTSSTSDGSDSNVCTITISGATHKREQLGLACLLHWSFNCPAAQSVGAVERGAALESNITISISDSDTASSWVALHDALGCDKHQLVLSDHLRVVTDATAFVEDVLVAKAQIVDCRTRDAFFGVDVSAGAAQNVAGHFDGAWNLPVASLFAATAAASETIDNDSATLLPLDALHDVVVNDAGVALTTPVAVLSSDPRDAALVATALVLAGHDVVTLSLVALTPTLVAAAPASFTAGIDRPDDALVFANDAGAFDLSPPPTDALPASTDNNMDAAAAKLILDAYAERVKGKDVSNVSDADASTDDDDDAAAAAADVTAVVWIHDGRRFFDMPPPITKPVFLDASLAILRVVSFVLAPFGFPSALHDALSLTDVKTQFGALFQDTIEVVSDLVYALKGLNEGAMAMSVHKWVERKRDPECSARVRAINDLWTTLYDVPRVVEVPDMPADRVVALATELQQELEAAVRKRASWAFEAAEKDASHSPSAAAATADDDAAQRKVTESWQCMYHSVVYALGFIPPEPAANHKKLSTLQLKSFIQAAAEATWRVVGDADVNQVEFQALCDTLPQPEQRAAIAAIAASAEQSLYATKHVLTRSVSKPSDAHASSLAAVRSAVDDGNRRARSNRHDVALAAYAAAFPHLPLFHRDLEHVLVGRANCLVQLNALDLARAAATTALRLHPFSADAYACLGRIDEKRAAVDAAMQHFVTAFILDGSRSPDLAEAIDRVSRVVGRRHAKDAFEQMTLKHELPAPWLTQSYFDAFEHDGDNGAKVPFDIEKTRTLPVEELDAATLLARAVHCKRTKRYSDAQRDVCALVALDDDDDALSPAQRALAYNLHASFLYVAGDVHAALVAIDQSLVFDPTRVNALVKKGGFLSELGSMEEALACFENASALDPNDADVHLHMGQMALLDGDYARAVQSLRRAMSRSEALAVTHVSYGMALYKSGSVYQANDVFANATAQFPQSPEVHLFHGEVLADQGNYAGAMTHFLTALELSPACPLPFLNAGRVYVNTNDPMRAIAHFEQALAIDPRCSSAHLDIAQVLFAQGRTTEAFAHFDLAAASCRFLPEVEEVCSCRAMAKMQLQVTEILGVELRHIMRSK